MGKIIISRRTERATETEFPGSIMATQVVSAEDAAASISLAKLGKDETASCLVKKHLTESNSQEVNCVTSVSQTKATKDITRKGDCSPAHSKKLTRELEGSSPHSFSGKEGSDWWNNSLSSCDGRFEFYDTEPYEDIPYWINYEHVDSNTDEKANNCCNKTFFTNSSENDQLSKISDHVTTFNPSDARSVSLGNDKSSNFTKTEERIRNLKALLAEQEKEIKRLKNKGKERIFESKESSTTLKKEYGFLFGTQLYKNAKDVSEQRQHGLINKNDSFEELKTSAATYTKQKRIGRENTGMSNTKRFRYNFRKDVPQEMNSCMNQTDDQKRTLIKEKATVLYPKPDIRKGTFTQDEFLSLLGLVTTARSKEYSNLMI